MSALVWTSERIVDAISDWTERNGRAPAARDWRNRAPGFPTAETVRQRFGTFDAARKAAGITFRRRNQAGEWTRQQILDAIYRWRYLNGVLPQSRDWAVSVDGFPTEWWVRKHFGTWNAAIVAAGYRPCQPRTSPHGYRARIALVTKQSHGPDRTTLTGARPGPSTKGA